jgi:hypothetical protein
MKSETLAEAARNWQPRQYSNLIRYVPSGKYYARIRVKGKLLRKSLKTTKISIAKLRLTDFEKAARRDAESRTEAFEGKMTFAEAAEVYSRRVDGDASLKRRTKDYHSQRGKALLKSWPELKTLELRRINKGTALNGLQRSRR